MDILDLYKKTDSYDGPDAHTIQEFCEAWGVSEKLARRRLDALVREGRAVKLKRLEKGKWRAVWKLA